MGWVTFRHIPDQSELTCFGGAGIILQEYVKTNTYLAAIPSHLSPSALLDYDVEAISPITSEHKEHNRIWSTPYPAWALEGDDIKLSVRTYAHVNLMSTIDQIEKIGGQIEEVISHSHLLAVRIPQQALSSLLSINTLRSIDLQSEPGRPESDEGRHLHRSNAIDNDYYGGRSYDGTGVSQAVNDDGFAGPHIDFKGRNAQATVANDLNGDHGDMVAGIAGGAGNLDPTMRGMAPGSFLYIRQYNANMGGTLNYHLDSNVLVFNSSYSNGCNAGYTNTTVLVDQEIYDNPTLMQSSQLETAMAMTVAMVQEINGAILQGATRWERMLLPRPTLERMTISKRAQAEDQHLMGESSLISQLTGIIKPLPTQTTHMPREAGHLQLLLALQVVLLNFNMYIRRSIMEMTDRPHYSKR